MKNEERSLLLVRKDRSRRIHFPATPFNRERFERLQLEFLTTPTLHPAARTVALLICWESVLDMQDLAAAYNALAAPINWQGHRRIQWVAVTGNHDARFLTCTSIAAFASSNLTADFDDACRKLTGALCEEYGSGEQAPLSRFMRESAQWFRFVLPPNILAHVTGHNRLSALPPCCIARESSRLAIAKEAADPTVDTEEDANRRQHLYAMCFDAALLGQEGTGLGSPPIDALLSALRPPSHGSDAYKRQVIRRNLSDLLTRIAEADEFCALLYGYAVELNHQGSLRKKQLAPTTPYTYLNAIARPLHAALEDRRISSLSADEYAEVFRHVLEARPGQTPRRAALAGMHRFLAQWWDVPSLPSDIFNVEDGATVAANTVWPHEMTKIVQWLQAAAPSRTNSQVEVAFAIAFEAPIRISELFALRIRSFELTEGQAWIEIARQRRDGREKSESGRRRITVRDPERRELIQGWLTRRVAHEGASPSDYLFGDPSDESKLFQKGHTYYLLNLLLKTATGDPDISFHTLRHSFATTAMTKSEVAAASKEVRDLDSTSVAMGHVGAHVSGHFYGHRFEHVITSKVESFLLPRLSSRQVAALSKRSDASVRQHFSRASRARGSKDATESRTAVVRALLTPATAAPDPAEGLALYEPLSPLARTVSPSTPTLTTVVHILEGLSKLQDRRSISLRCDVQPSVVRQCEHAVGLYGERYAAVDTSLSAPEEVGVRALRSREQSRLGFVPNFSAATLRSELSCIRRAVGRLDPELVQSAGDYWRFSLQSGEVSLQPGPAMLRFAEFLARCGFPARLLGIRYHANAPAIDLESVRHAFEGTLGIAPQVFQLSPRAGRPPITLVLGSGAEFLRANGRGADMAGFNSLMLAVWVWRRLVIEGRP